MCRNGLRAIVADDLGLEVVASAGELAGVIAALRSSDGIAALVIGADLPGLDGLASLHMFRRQWPALRILTVVSLLDRDTALAALSAGAHGCVAMEASSEELAAACSRVLSGQTYVPEVVVNGAARANARGGVAARLAALSPRQREVISGVIAGKSCKEIARDLDIAEGTVKIHTHAAYRALGVRNRVEALVTIRDAE